ncbi:hypothetical protein [Methylobacterium sp. J-076]|uniref:hypothetical protein n=1 Tax=Methylobacterium sp. J-076 TaxID=2836655 RepID=UPI001FBA82D7|nr:hypothetical protein [Methylobacterium sp. J-076]MCJ2013998.1 hypothetical protein [Methylobacterium sp. J-076]
MSKPRRPRRPRYPNPPFPPALTARKTAPAEATAHDKAIGSPIAPIAFAAEPIPIARDTGVQPAPVESVVIAEPAPEPAATVAETTPARIPPAQLGAEAVGTTVMNYFIGEGEAFAAHLRALAGARTMGDFVRLQIGEFQRAADATLTCWGALTVSAARTATAR